MQSLGGREPTSGIVGAAVGVLYDFKLEDGGTGQSEAESRWQAGRLFSESWQRLGSGCRWFRQRTVAS